MRILALALLLLVTACQREAAAPEPANQAAETAEAGPKKGVDRSRKGQPAPDVTFNDPDGGEIGMAEFKGVPTLVNLWASWCAPCVKELPTLDKLAARYEREGNLGIVAVSQDNAPQGSVVAFLDKLKVTRLGAFHDPRMALSGGLGVEVMPTTVLFDAQGKEVWRYVGDLDWTGEEASKLLAEGGVRTAG